MAKRKIFIKEVVENYPLKRGSSNYPWSYSYDAHGTLKVYRGDQEKAKRYHVKVGEAFMVEVRDGEARIQKLNLPQDDRALLMWLLSFGNPHRAYNEESYTKLATMYQERYNWLGYNEKVVTDEAKGHERSYAFSLCTVEDGTTRRVAAMINREPNKALVKEILQRCTSELHISLLYPRFFVKDLLRARFGFTDQDLDDIRHLPYWGEH